MRFVRAAAGLALAAAFIFAWAPALAASQLSGIVVVPARGGASRIVLNFLGGVPAGWAVTGAGTQTATVLLPGTTPIPSMNQLAYAGAGAVSSITVAQSGSNLTVTLHLTSPVPIASHGTTGVLILDVAAAPVAMPTPPGPEGPPAQAGDIGNGQSYEVVPLKYADVSEVVGLLVQGQQVQPNDVFNPEGSIFSLPTSSNGIPTQTGPSPFGPGGSQQATSFGERVNDNIGFDRRLNAIVLYGSAEQIAQYKSFIAAVDVPVPSVMLECEVIELNQTAASNLGLDFTNGNGAIATGSASLGPLGGTTGFTAPNLTAQLQAQVFATIENGGGQILATPRVLAVNGASAQILSGDALPILSTIIYPGSTVTTQQNVNYVAVGINMQIQPRIDVDGYVTSHIFAEVSSVTQYIQTTQGQVPQISLRQVSTQATVKDGEPFIVGGLLKDEEITSLSKIPGIGDMPLIGGLFRVRHETTQRTNLYIFITPHIIHTTGYQNPGSTRRDQLPQPEVPGPLPRSNAVTPAPLPPAAAPEPAPTTVPTPVATPQVRY